jgi:hypothetical protein
MLTCDSVEPCEPLLHYISINMMAGLAWDADPVLFLDEVHGGSHTDFIICGELTGHTIRGKINRGGRIPILG